MYPEISTLIDLVTVSLVLVVIFAFARLVLAWWGSRE